MAHSSSHHNLEEQIAAAVDELPSILHLPNAEKVGSRVHTWIDPRHHQKRRLVWLGVSIFVIAIIGVWIVNTQSVFEQVRTQGFPEKVLLERAKADSEQIMNTVEAKNDLQTVVTERQKQEAVRASLQAAFAHVIDSANAADATSTIAPAATSTLKK